jgi:hypothetical protein
LEVEPCSEPCIELLSKGIRNVWGEVLIEVERDFERSGYRVGVKV